MNSKLIKGSMEALVVVAISCGLLFLPVTYQGFRVDIAILPLIVFALRRGVLPSIITNIVFGLVSFFLQYQTVDAMSANFVDTVGAYVMVTLAALFARNTVRTAFNVRLTSTRLNIVTASLFAVLASQTMHIFAMTMASQTLLNESVVSFSQAFQGMWFIMLGLWMAISVLLVILLQIKREIFVPKNTRFLSRREKSHLLND